jgi:hypothetical protein
LSRDIVHILMGGVMRDVDGAGCDRDGGAGRSAKSAVARDYGVSRRWVQILVARYLAEGEAAFEPRSRRPRTGPRQTSRAVEDAIVGWRKRLTEAGHDAGAETIAWHLRQQAGFSPSVATIWRFLSCRGFVIPQPHKRPRSSWRRFQADLPMSSGSRHHPLAARRRPRHRDPQHR